MSKGQCMNYEELVIMPMEAMLIGKSLMNGMYLYALNEIA